MGLCLFDFDVCLCVHSISGQCASNYEYAYAHGCMLVHSLCVYVYVCVFEDSWSSTLSRDQSVPISLCSHKMFVLFAKHRPINSA